MSDNILKSRRNNGSNNQAIYWIVIGLLLAGCIYLYVSKNNTLKESEADHKSMSGKIDSVAAEREQVQKEFEAASARIDDLLTQNAKLDSSLRQDNTEIENMRKRIAGMVKKGNATAADLKKAKELVKNLNDKIALYQERITQLEKENEVLQGKNATLTHERDSTSAQNTVLKREASVLHAGNIRLEPIHLKRSGKEVHTSKARKVDVLRITFDILENRIAESGNKAIYVRIIAPGGSTLSNAANASGNLTSAQGSAIPYSVMKDVALTKGTPINNITLDWKQDGDYEKGNYTIEIYNEGYKVGTGSVNMR